MKTEEFAGSDLLQKVAQQIVDLRRGLLLDPVTDAFQQMRIPDPLGKTRRQVWSGKAITARKQEPSPVSQSSDEQRRRLYPV